MTRAGNKEEEMREDEWSPDEGSSLWGGGGSEGGDGSQTSMKLPSVTDYQGSAFHYLPFITRYLWQQEVLESHETHATHLPQRSNSCVHVCVCVCVCVCVRERDRERE